MTTDSRIARTLIVLAVLSPAGILFGCAHKGVQTSAYEGIYDDLEKVIAEASHNSHTIQSVEAKFCLRRAFADRKDASKNSNLDSAMLVTAGLVGGFGATVGAGSAAMDESGAKKNLQIAGATTVAASAAILALRTTLALNDLARTQRIAAANSLDAAVVLVTSYALADDPKDVKDDGFHICRDEDINVARSFPGAKTQEAAEKAATKAAEEVKEATAQVAKSEATVNTTSSELNKKLADLEAAKANLIAIKKQIDLSGKKDDPVLQKKADEAQTQKESLQDSVTELKSKLDAARQDLLEKQMQVARAELQEAKAAFLASTSRLRRMLYFGTTDDVRMARDSVRLAFDDLMRGRRRVRHLQKVVDESEGGSADVTALQSGTAPEQNTKEPGIAADQGAPKSGTAPEQNTKEPGTATDQSIKKPDIAVPELSPSQPSTKTGGTLPASGSPSP